MENNLTKSEALELALYLAVTAPDNDKQKMCTDIAINIASGMDGAEVKRCKTRVALRLKDER